MSVIGFFIVSLLSLSQAVPDQVCYEHLGCFGDEYPWTGISRLGVGLPASPNFINTRHLLYTRSNPDREFELLADKDLVLKNSYFNGTLRTVFVLHGFADNTYQPWVQDMISALLTNRDINVIVVDWKIGAEYYTDAVANIRVVGAEIIRLINYLTNVTELTLDRVHLVGHDLGAHAASYVGTSLPQIQRITGLDPSAFYFDDSDPLVYLDSTDALFVDIIHTDGSGLIHLGMGTTMSTGSVDFYPNQGKYQPGCDNETIDKIIGSLEELLHHKFKDGEFQKTACSHFRSVYYFTESISSPCGFIAMPCESQEHFDDGKCVQSCQTKESCQHMGYHSVPSGPYENMYLNTEDQPAFCESYVTVSVTVDSSQHTTRGKLTALLRGSQKSADASQVIVDGKIKAGYLLYAHDYVRLLGEGGLGEIASVDMTYYRSGLFESLTLKITEVEVTVLQGQMKETRTLFQGATLHNGKATTLKLLEGL